MSEIEVPTEHLQEAIHEAAHGAHGSGGGHASGPHASGGIHWVSAVALSSALLAVMAAVAALLAGHHANEGVLEQIQASNRWAQYQSKSIKASVLQSKVDLLGELEKKSKPEDLKKLGEYPEEMKQIKERAEEFEKSSEHHMSSHNLLARVVTVVQIAIALAAVSVLTRKRWLWGVSLGLGAIGFVLLAMALLH